MNQNHPKQGSRIAVDPIPESGIANIKRLLANKPRDFLLFTLGVNNGLRISDLLGLKVQDVKGLKVGETVKLREQKTGKANFPNGQQILSQGVSGLSESRESPGRGISSSLQRVTMSL